MTSFSARATPLVGLALVWLLCLLFGGANAMGDVEPMRLLHAAAPVARAVFRLLTDLGGFVALFVLTSASTAYLG